MGLLGKAQLRMLSPNIKALLGPVVAILVLFSLFVFSVQKGYGQIKSKLDELNSASENEKTLEEKVSILREVKSSLGNADKTVMALPYKNPGAWMISQLKALAASNSLILSNLGLANESDFSEGVSKVQISFDAEGQDLVSLLAFMKGVKELAPVSTLDEVDVESQGVKNLSADIRISIYWSPPPTVLPPITTPVKQLTSSEQQLLNSVSALSEPQFTVFSPEPPAQRDNPFE